MISCYYSSQVAELFAVIYARTHGGPGAGEKMTTAEGMLFKGVKPLNKDLFEMWAIA